MREMTCIVCPNGCHLIIDDSQDKLQITGNLCPKGADFARSELTHPMRTICSTVRTVFEEIPVIPVKVSAEIPKNAIFDVMREINRVTVTERLGTGDVVIENVAGLGVNVIITSNRLKGERNYE